MNITNYLSQAVRKLLLGKTPYTVPTTYYIALVTTTPDATGAATEVAGNGYTRATVTNDTTNWTDVSGHSKNLLAINFPFATASWGTIVGAVVWDDPTAGNPLYYGTLTSSVSIGLNDAFQFAPGDVDLVLS